MVAIAGWALASGVAGVAADVLLLLFYVEAMPWEDSPGAPTWYGTANDWLVIVQFAALLPVMYWLGRQLGDNARVRAWTRLGLAAAAGITGLQVLLLAGVLDFAVQGPLVGACAVLTLGWVWAISGAGPRALPARLARFGRLLGPGTAVAVVAFALGALVSETTGISWAWVAGGLPGFVVWALLPVWTLLLAPALNRPVAGGMDANDHRRAGEADARDSR